MKVWTVQANFVLVGWTRTTADNTELFDIIKGNYILDYPTREERRC